MQPRRHEDTKKNTKNNLILVVVASAIMPVALAARPFPGRDRGPDQPPPRLWRSAVASAKPESPTLLQPANADNGKRLFMTYYCYSCHGTDGQGGAGPRLVARATPDSLIRYVRKPTGGNMPAYTSKVIADQDLMDIHAYLRSIPPSPAAKTIALLQQ